MGFLDFLRGKPTLRSLEEIRKLIGKAQYEEYAELAEDMNRHIEEAKIKLGKYSSNADVKRILERYLTLLRSSEEMLRKANKPTATKTLDAAIKVWQEFERFLEKEEKDARKVA